MHNLTLVQSRMSILFSTHFRDSTTSISKRLLSKFSSSSPLSGLQREVLALYRTILRAAYQKERSTKNGFVHALQDQQSNTAHAAEEFRRQAGQVRRNDFRTIEYKIRHGYKQVKLLQMPGVTKVMVGGGKNKKQV